MINNEAKGFLPAMSRRELMSAGLKGLLGVAPVAMLPGLAHASSISLPDAGDFEVSFKNYHTREEFNGVYRVGNKYLPEAFEEINTVMRDFRTGDAFPIDPRLMDILHMIQKKTKGYGQLEILSGYRSAKTNAWLARNSNGVARNSLHMTGQAADIRLAGYSTRRIRDHAINLRAGGVGYYKKSGFVHVDTGQVRHW